MATDYDNRITYLGHTDWRNIRKRFGIRDNDRAFHTHIIGTTGSGKSTLLLNMIIQDVQRGLGCAIIDPHGDLCERLLHYIPKERIEDVVYFNATDTEFPIGFNPLANVAPEYHHLVASGLISTFEKVFTSSWGPRLEHYMRFSLLTLLEYGQATLLDVQPLLTDANFREQVLQNITNPHLLSFWRNEHGKAPTGFRVEAISPVLNKLGIFVSSTTLRNTFGQRQGSFTMQQIFQERKILILNVAKGIIGEDVSALLGSVLITAIQNAALFRATQPEEKRTRFYLYVDEMQTFVSLSFSDLLSESKKYGLALCMAHQFRDQLHERVRSAITGNIGTTICFRVGINDAKHYAKQFHPVFDETDFINLPKYAMYLRLMIDGTVSKPFNAISLILPGITESYEKQVVAASRATYARNREMVEAELKVRYFEKPVSPDTPSLF